MSGRKSVKQPATSDTQKDLELIALDAEEALEALGDADQDAINRIQTARGWLHRIIQRARSAVKRGAGT